MALNRPVVTTETETLTAEAAVATAQATPEVAERVDVDVQVAVTEPVAHEVVVAKAATAPTVTEQRTNAMAQFSQEQAEAGFEGLDLTGMSFERIKLHEGSFKLGSEDTDIGNTFDCVIHSTRRLFVVRQSDDQNAETFYSYDPKGLTFTDGSSAAERLQEWAEDGYGTEDSPLDIKEYLEAMATLINRDDEHNDAMVMLSIPPASRAKLAGHAAQCQVRQHAMLNEIVTRCSVGKQVGEGTKKFRPWVFQIAGRYEG